MLTKKLAVFLLSSSSSLALAGIMPYGWDKEDDAIWQVQFEGQFDDQSNNLAQATSDGTGLILEGGNSQIDTLAPPLGEDPDRDWGYSIGLAYILPSHKYDVRGHYTWLNSDKNVSEDHSIDISTSPGSVFETVENTAQASFDFDYRDADITLGRILKFGRKTLIRLGVGIGYADIKQNTDNASTETSPSRTCTVPASPCLTTTGSFENKFRGMGPKFTFDGQYNFNWMVAIVGGVGISGLFGESEANMHTTLDYADPAIGSLTGSNVHVKDDKTAIGIDGRLGLEFTPIMNDDVALNIEVGYQFASYLNALQEGSVLLQQDLTGQGNNGDVGYQNILENFDDDYSNSGLFVNISLNYM